MYKVKHERTADCVVAGFRWNKNGGVIGSLLLGLYRPTARCSTLGCRLSFPMSRRAEWSEELAPYRTDDHQRAPVGRVGRRQQAPRWRPPARCGQPLERQEGSVMGADTA